MAFGLEHSTDSQDSTLSGKKVRLIVRSAEEAVQIIREKLGPGAQVLSVKQVEGEGLARFLRAPRLEVIAVMPDEKEPKLKAPLKSPSPQAGLNLDAIYRAAGMPNGAPMDDQQTDSLKTLAISAVSGRLEALLRRSGFDDGLLNDFFCQSQWKDWQALPLAQGVTAVGHSLIEAFKKVQKQPLSTRIALFGTPGVGTTTALCKLLSQAVFWKAEEVEVLKFEGDAPNPDQALGVFCDVLGAPLHRDPLDIPHLNPLARLFIDIPGLPSEVEGWKAVRSRLDELKVQTRILVAHAAYEGPLLEKAYALATRMQATHVLFTHTDEVDNVSKLWRFFLRGRLAPIGLSHGQSVTGDFTADPLPWLLERTFPSGLLEGIGI
jgi:flagellar biosynthesis protein FlhF